MNRKLVALLVAIMLVASSVPAFADTWGPGGTAQIDAIVDLLNAKIDYDLYNYEIIAEGIKLNFHRTIYVADYTQYYDATAGLVVPDAAKPAEYAKYLDTEDEWTTDTIYAADVIRLSKAEAEAEGYTLTGIELVNGTYLAMKGGKYYAITLSMEINKDQAGTNVVKTGPDYYDHHYTNYTNQSIIEKVSFCPDKDAFGDGLNFSHDVAKTLFTVKARCAATLYIVVKDEDGRLFPITTGTWDSARNAYKVDVAKGETITVKWFGTDGMDWHKEGSLGTKGVNELLVMIEASTSFITDVFGNTTTVTDGASIRFDYVVQHAVKNHSAAANGNASAPKTGDARMAYVTLASLVVMAGVAVIITRKLRTNA